ncbi:mannose-1-phosphate guanylyltransferase/mannose-6-phosphate isomerase [Oceanicella actignis]|uniref:mannose-1-phosphate guanylyltransferase n=1 Tax=Oceanicella actignis TaxID=1189325 RepID=A0A1M7SRW5_9RHOB|nr:mannose-1-phosphate guanylyltransferase/mannose-6-phosphate isomerase [Oceanicella actignis]TYO90771.1 mannose-1-phosphate guanylyltransferase/mannose-1-phosphate guanylyltransferase/mannose-6-phosphate isomerase [Oceanicella actignis]SES68109.1 mannose-1-phosphate guanylyltransferase / mannose-6-phosphate isomerase [Oceanicella actignis]SHN61158.1 mannose-1-phosphate guanylyltransferase/mannose-1-phosphate guanylyltransferase / mannose-6-phosphate isomerase [Oceanicella actignis]
MTTKIHPVILCGGSGTRLWPLSRKSYPKQFGRVFGELSLFQRTAARLSGPDFAPPMLLTTSDFRFIVGQQLTEMGMEPGRILIEPAGRNTGPAILAAALALRDTPQALMLVAPSDHLIADEEAFRAAVRAGAAAAAEGRLVTFGVAPDRPETGYGYLELDEADADGPVRPLRRFVEKPDAETAAQMLASGRFLWNAGIFLFSVGAALEAYRAHAPDLIAPVRRALEEGREDLDFFRLAEEPWLAARDVSVDYAIMEKAGNLAVAPLGGGWNDLGSWTTVWRETGPDADGVALSGEATAIDCRDTLLRSENEGVRLVGIGLENIVAVATRDAVLVADMAQSQRVREAVAALKAQGAAQAEEFPRFHRPWGWYETLAMGERFQVKVIQVRPGGKLSLQSHMHRSEHWVVVEGTARVTVGAEERLLTENESVYIPLGATHRLENPGKVPLRLIEVQSGPYLGEDDIIRYEDIYARG